MRYSSAFRRRLRDANIRSFDKLIHHQDKEWLIKNFSHRATKYPINITMLIRNLIWQMKERIQKGEKAPLTELIRTYWYMYLKPALSRADSLSDKPDNHYNSLIEQLSAMVTDYDIIRYKELGFRDEKAAFRKAGENANIIVFAEKAAHWSFLSDLNDKYRVNVMAFGGFPSLMSTEYFMDSIKETGIDMRRSFYLFSICDFDPAGIKIENSFINNLNFFGIKNVKVKKLVTPDMLTEDEIRVSRYRLSRGRRSRNKRWYEKVKKKNYNNMKYLIDTDEKTGDKIFYGLHADSVSTVRLTEKLENEMVPVLGKKEDFLKVFEMEKLDEAIKRYIVYQITGD